MNLTEIKYTIDNIVLTTSKMLKTHSPKVVYGSFAETVFFDASVNEIYVNEWALNNLNNITNVLFELFKNIRYNYQCNVIKTFTFLEDENTLKVWKNEQIKRLMLDKEEYHILNTETDAIAFSLLMLFKFFNIDLFLVKDFDEKIIDCYKKLKKKYIV